MAITVNLPAREGEGIQDIEEATAAGIAAVEAQEALSIAAVAAAPADVIDAAEAASLVVIAAAEDSTLEAVTDAGEAVTGAGGTIDTREDVALAAIASSADERLIDIASATGPFYTSVADALSMGVASVAISAAGSGGTNGTYPWTTTGGGGTEAAGYLVVAGGAITSVVVEARGRGYTSAPTLVYTVAGLTGETLTVSRSQNQTAGSLFTVMAATVGTVYEVDVGGTTATEIGEIASIAKQAEVLRANADLPYVLLDFAEEAYSPRLMADMLTGTPTLATVEGMGTRAAGALIEEARTNRAWWTEMGGAAVGVIGSGGAYPTGWHIANSVAVTSVEIDSYGSGEINITVTPNGTAGTWILQFNPLVDLATALAGEDWTGSVEISQTGAAPSVVATKLWMIERDGAGTFVAAGTQTIVLMAGEPFAHEINRTIVNTGTLTFGIGVQFSTATDPVTLRIRKPQIEMGAFRTSYVASEEGDGVRAATALTVTEAADVLGVFPQASEAHFRLGRASVGTITQADDGTNDNRETVFYEDYVVKRELVIGGVVIETQTGGQALRYAASRIALTSQPGLARLSLNGNPAVTGGGAAPAFSRFQIGAGARGSLNGWMQKVTLHRKTLWSAAEVVDRSVPPLALYDNFTRSNRALIGDTAPTGQVYTGVEAGENPSVVAPLITSGKYVADGAGSGTTAVYLSADMGTAPTSMRAAITVAAGSGVDVAALICTASGGVNVTDITINSLHPVFETAQVNLGYYKAAPGDGSGLANVASVTYPAMTQDGATVTQIGWRRYGNNIILELPNGKLVSFTNADAVSVMGRVIFDEIFRFATSYPRVKFIAIHNEG